MIIQYGGDNYSLDQEISKIRQAKRLSVLLSGEELTEQGLINIYEQYSEAPRFLIVDHAEKIGSPKKGKKKGKKSSAKEGAQEDEGPPLARLLKDNQTNKHTIIIAVLRTETLSEFWKGLAEAPGVKSEHHPALKPWEVTEAAIGFAETCLKGAGGKVEPGVIPLLVDLTGGDFYSLRNEIAKLSRLASETGQQISKQDVLDIVPRTAKVDGWRIADLAFQKEYRKALEAFSFLCQQEDTGSAAVVVTASLAKKVEMLLAAKSVVEVIKNPKDVAELLGMNSFVYSKNVEPVLKLHSFDSLLTHLKLIAKLDLFVKSAASIALKRSMVETTFLKLTK